MLAFIIISFIILVLFALYCCLAHSTEGDRLQDDELQMEFLKEWQDTHNT